MKRRIDGKHVANDYLIKNRVATAFEDGRATVKIAKATFDVSATDSSGQSNATTATHGLGVYIPDNAIVLNSWLDVVQKVSSGATGTVAVQIESAGDVIATTLTSAGMFNTSTSQGLLVKDSAPLKVTAEREIKVVVATQNLNFGKFVIYAEYIEGR